MLTVQDLQAFVGGDLEILTGYGGNPAPTHGVRGPVKALESIPGHVAVHFEWLAEYDGVPPWKLAQNMPVAFPDSVVLPAPDGRGRLILPLKDGFATFFGPSGPKLDRRNVEGG